LQTAMFFGIAIWGVVFLYKMWKFQSHIFEYRWLLFTLYNFILVLAVGIPLITLGDEIQQSIVILSIILLFITTTNAFIYVTKIFGVEHRINKRKAQKKSNSTTNTTRTKYSTKKNGKGKDTITTKSNDSEDRKTVSKKKNTSTNDSRDGKSDPKKVNKEKVTKKRKEDDSEEKMEKVTKKRKEDNSEENKEKVTKKRKEDDSEEKKEKVTKRRKEDNSEENKEKVTKRKKGR